MDQHTSSPAPPPPRSRSLDLPGGTRLNRGSTPASPAPTRPGLRHLLTDVETPPRRWRPSSANPGPLSWRHRGRPCGSGACLSFTGTSRMSADAVEISASAPNNLVVTVTSRILRRA